ncbi:MAG: hypothetical protein HC927_12245 [Deltaproteobacteria bacterium]|nr:hypothetical protein [Deltaproteobacteria bacterium]
MLELGEAVNIEYLPSEAWAAMLQARRAQREQGVAALARGGRARAGAGSCRSSWSRASRS